jgi:HEAT repeat protein
LLKVLIQTLNEDPNVNVRMAALDGLRKFYQEPLVRKALIGSLAIQKDPVIQIYLIQILVEMKDKAAVQPLKQIIENEELIPAVKDEANMGILVLS